MNRRGNLAGNTFVYPGEDSDGEQKEESDTCFVQGTAKGISGSDDKSGKYHPAVGYECYGSR